MALFRRSFTISNQVLDGPEDEAQYYERWRQRRLVKILVYKAISVKSPHLLGVLLHSFKCVTVMFKNSYIGRQVFILLEEDEGFLSGKRDFSIAVVQ